MGALRTSVQVMKGAWSLVGGMAITLREFLSRDVVQQYPEERMVMHGRFRGRVDMPLDPLSGAHKCTLCMMCMRACPNGSIEVVAGKGPDGKRVLEAYVYKLSTCTLCGLCVEACNFDAIRMSHDYETAAFDRQALTLILNRPAGRQGEAGIP